MSSIIKRACAIAIIPATAPFWGLASAAPTVTTIASFDATVPAFGTMMAASDGYLYGNTWTGSAPIVYRVTPAGAFVPFATLDSSHGQGVMSLLEGPDANFYAVLIGFQDFSSGGYHDGAAMRVPKSGGASSTIALLDNAGLYGPFATVGAVDGNFYGVVEDNSGGGCGALFQLTTAGNLTEMVSFDSSIGCAPRALTAGNDGNLYGATDSFSSANSIFKYTLPNPPLAKNGKVTALYALPAGWRISNLAADAFGNVYFGTNRVSPDGAFTELMASDGAWDLAGMDGQVYATIYNGTGPLTFAVIDPTGHVSPITQVPDRVELQAPDGSFIGRTETGGANGDGEIFRVTLDGQSTRLTAQTQIVTTDPTHPHLKMKALLKSAAGSPVAGRRVEFSAPNGASLCSGITDASGTAACGTPATNVRTAYNQAYRAHFAGDAIYRGSWAGAKLIQ